MTDRTSLLSSQDFRLLWGGITLSELATQTTLFILPLLAATVLHATPLQVGLVTAASTTAFLAVGLPAGAWVDRTRRRKLLVVGDTGRALLLGSVAITAYTGSLTLTQLYVAALGSGVLAVFFDVADQGYLPHVTGKDRLVEGNAKIAATKAVAQVSGPGLGGLLAQALAVPYALAVIALNHLASGGSIAAVRRREARPKHPQDPCLGREIREGMRLVLGHRVLRAIAACTSWSNLCNTALRTMLIVLLAQRLELSAGTVGLFFTLVALGGVAGGMLARRTAERFGHGRAAWMSVGIAAPFGLLAPLADNGWRLWAAAAGLLVSAFGRTLYNVIQISYRQRVCPERMLGRMSATMRFLVWGAIPLGALVGGVLGSTIGLRPTLWVAAGAATLAFLPILRSPPRETHWSGRIAR